MNKIVNFSEQGAAEYYLCELQEIPFEKESEYFGQDDIVKWSYGWGDIGYHYMGKLTGTTKFGTAKKDYLWVFYKQSDNYNWYESMYYDKMYESTRGKLFKLIKKIKQVNTVKG